MRRGAHLHHRRPFAPDFRALAIFHRAPIIVVITWRAPARRQMSRLRFCIVPVDAHRGAQRLINESTSS